jgi:hypothetical protein
MPSACRGSEQRPAMGARHGLAAAIEYVQMRPALFGLLVLIPQLVHACSCGGVLTSCERGWISGETIFVGEATSLEKVAQPGPGLPVSYAVHFAVEESFRGTGVRGSEIVVDTGFGGGDCGYPFVPGTRYLVYAWVSGKRPYAGICGQTKPAIMAEGVLRELRAMRDQKRLDDIFGTIGMAPKGNGFEALTETQPLAGVPVRAIAGSGASFSTQTDGRGAYAFPSLPSGTYTVEPGFRTGLGRLYEPLTADVRASGAACRVDSFVRPNGQITGTVVDALGKAIPGFVTIQPADPAEAAVAQRRGGMPGYQTVLDGRFSLPQLPAGRYRLVFHPWTGGRVDFRTTFYWPSNPDDAIDIGFGQHIDGVECTTGLLACRFPAH